MRGFILEILRIHNLVNFFLSTAHQKQDFVSFIVLFSYRNHCSTHTRILSHCLPD